MYYDLAEEIKNVRKTKFINDFVMNNKEIASATFLRESPLQVSGNSYKTVGFRIDEEAKLQMVDKITNTEGYTVSKNIAHSDVDVNALFNDYINGDAKLIVKALSPVIHDMIYDNFNKDNYKVKYLSTEFSLNNKSCSMIKSLENNKEMNLNREEYYGK